MLFIIINNNSEGVKTIIDPAKSHENAIDKVVFDEIEIILIC